MKNKMYYIQWNSKYGTETIDETDNYETALYLVNEYNLAYGGGCVIREV